MRGLNDALDKLRVTVPTIYGWTSAQGQLTNRAQKMSKIETLRLARNYIAALTEILSGGHRLEPLLYAQFLCQGLSQTTINIVSSQLGVNAKDVSRPTVESKQKIDFYLSQVVTRK